MVLGFLIVSVPLGRDLAPIIVIKFSNKERIGFYTLVEYMENSTTNTQGCYSPSVCIVACLLSCSVCGAVMLRWFLGRLTGHPYWAVLSCRWGHASFSLEE